MVGSAPPWAATRCDVVMVILAIACLLDVLVERELAKLVIYSIDFNVFALRGEKTAKTREEKTAKTIKRKEF